MTHKALPLSKVLGFGVDTVDDEVVDYSFEQNNPISASRVISEDTLGLIGGKLRYNTLNGQLYLDDYELSETEVKLLTIRTRFDAARRLVVGMNKSGKPITLKLAKNDIEDAILEESHKRPFNPLQDYLNGLTWDGVSRLAEFIKALGCEDNTLNRTMLRKWLVSAVARGLRPGTKVDTMLILVGDQGIRKSSLFKCLAGENLFNDTPMTIGDKDSYMAMSKSWIVEWAELESMRGKEVNQLKAFLSSSTDSFRRPYMKNVEAVPRCAVVVGTTNTSEFLTDDTGNRRYWVIECKKIDLALAQSIRDQLWAEAVSLFKQGEKWFFDATDLTDASLLKPLEERQEQHVVHDEWSELIREYVDNTNTQKEGVTIAEILTDGLNLNADRVLGWNSRRVAKILKELGWVQNRTKTSRRWYPDDDAMTLDDTSTKKGSGNLFSN